MTLVPSCGWKNILPAVWSGTVGVCGESVGGSQGDFSEESWKKQDEHFEKFALSYKKHLLASCFSLNRRYEKLLQNEQNRF